MTVQADPAKATDVKHKIKVGGVEKELTYEQLVEAAQKGEDYHAKTTELSQRKKELETQEANLGEWKNIIKKIDGDPKLRDTLSKTITDYEKGTVSTSTVDRNLKTIEKRIEEAPDAETREQLEEARQMILEVSKSQEMEKELIAVREELAFLRSNTLSNISDRVEKGLSDISNTFGKDVVEKYKNEIRLAANKYPNQSIKKLFFYYASDEDAENALLNKAKVEKEKEHQTKTNGSMAGGGTTTHTKIEAPRDKKGRVDWSALGQKLKDQGRFNIA